MGSKNYPVPRERERAVTSVRSIGFSLATTIGPLAYLAATLGPQPA